jgi:Ca2+-binding RTX toxin-like protein
MPSPIITGFPQSQTFAAGERRVMPPPPQSANGTVVVDGSSAVITDAQGNAWRLTGPYGVDGYGVAVNGIPVANDYGVTQIGYFSGTVWQGTATTWTEAALGGLTVTDTTTHTRSNPAVGTTGPDVAVSAYSGPVAGLTGECIAVTSDSLNITATTPGWFLKGGAGNDALAASSGNNVLDGGGGSNFLTGGRGTDVFYLDDRTPAATIWSTIANFHSGDSATIWGVTPADFSLTWLNGRGAAGFTGLTAVFSAPGKPQAALTLAGLNSADLRNGKLAISYGATANEPGIPGSVYMNIRAT